MRYVLFAAMMVFTTQATARAPKVSCFGQSFYPNETKPEVVAESARPFDMVVELSKPQSLVIDDRLEESLVLHVEIEEVCAADGGPCDLYALTTEFTSGATASSTFSTINEFGTFQQHLTFRQGNLAAFVNCIGTAR